LKSSVNCANAGSARKRIAVLRYFMSFPKVPVALKRSSPPRWPQSGSARPSVLQKTDWCC
jgi:hypothetical protein